MAEPFLSEIRLFGFNWAPQGWALCDGQSLPINQNQALFSLLGTQYGGDGRTSFNLPDLRSRVPIGVGTNQGLSYDQGARGGEENVTVTVEEMGAHTHGVRGTTTQADFKQFSSAIFADAYDFTSKQPTLMYAQAANLQGLNPDSVSSNGGGGLHPNIQPSLAVNFCIALSGVFPSRN